MYQQILLLILDDYFFRSVLKWGNLINLLKKILCTMCIKLIDLVSLLLVFIVLYRIILIYHASFYLIFVFFMLYKHDSLFMCASES